MRIRENWRAVRSNWPALCQVISMLRLCLYDNPVRVPTVFAIDRLPKYRNRQSFKSWKNSQIELYSTSFHPVTNIWCRVEQAWTTTWRSHEISGTTSVSPTDREERISTWTECGCTSEGGTQRVRYPSGERSYWDRNRTVRGEGLISTTCSLVNGILQTWDVTSAW